MQAQTADEIINHHLQAIGGKEKLSAIKTLIIEGEYDMGEGLKAPFKQYIVTDKFVRSEFSLQGQTMIRVAKNDNTGWAISPFGGNKNAEPMPEMEIKKMQLAYDFTKGLLNYTQNGNTIEYFGIDDFEGVDIHKIKVTLKTGQIVYHYIDAETYFDLQNLVKIKLGDKEEKNENSFSNFNTIDYGVVIPFTQNERSLITKVTVNAPIDEHLFDMPLKN